MKCYVMPQTMCPACQKPLDRASHALGDDDSPPRDGDITICAYCGTLLIFKDGGRSVRLGAESDLESFSKKDRAKIEQMQKIIIDYNVKRGGMIRA